MRIGIDARMFGSAPGIGRYIEELFKEIVAADSRNEYVLFLREPALRQYVVPGPRVRKVAAPERWYSFSEQCTLPFRFWRERLDLLFVPQFNAPIIAPCPFVVTIHDVTQLYMPGTLQRASMGRRAAFRFVFSRAVHRARIVIAVSEYTKREIEKNFHIPPSKIRVIHEGAGLLPTVRESTIPGSRGDAGTVAYAYLLAVGVWRPHKNLTGLLDAFAILMRENAFPGLKLVLAGDEDPRYPEVRERIDSLGLREAVLTPGTPSDTALDALYRGAQAVVIPSLYEGFGFVGLEAIARGVPVIASRAAALPEILGDAAAYIDPMNPQGMAVVIARVLRDAAERERLSAAAPAVLARYSWKRAARATLEVFRAAA